MTDYAARLSIPLNGADDCTLFTPAGLMVARGYERVATGGRGPYVEFLPPHILADRFHIPEDQAYRVAADYVYYIEYRSNCAANVKAYLQRRRVNYADYIPGRWYVSPFDLVDSARKPLISPLRSAPPGSAPRSLFE